MDPASTTSSASDLAQRKLVIAHDALMKTPGLQFDFEPEKIPVTPAWLLELLRQLAVLAPFLTWVFWGGLALAVIFVVWFLAREFLLGRRRPAPARSTVDWQPEPAQARSLLQDADRLAAAGAFGEAVHLLLIRSINDISSRRPGVVRPALTSRDIAGLEALPSTARDAFLLMARMVEHSLFGGRAVSAEDFGLCRRHYEAFALPEGWR